MFGLIKSYDMLDNMNMFNVGDNGTFSVKSLENEWFANSFVSSADNGYEVIVELPGLSRSDIEVTTVGSNLVVSATREFKSSNSSYTRQFKKTWALPEKTINDSISARYEAGLLKINVPVKKDIKRKIEIE